MEDGNIVTVKELYKNYQKELRLYKVRKFYYCIVRKIYHLFNKSTIIGKYLVKIGKRIGAQQDRIICMQKELIEEMS